ncbi:MAG: ATP-dependent DNA ligase LigD [Candidatus Saccharicenans subterraneus]|uniref:ATP-dependent DNA ligase LigD n=1 Tax=Candidatus Saccharicenans subterraneus TaxID=2508984 RepID=A0A3E2BMZ8_9BACT|nr:MAG: ATP-dependent DNA ligase LigD [Candidatus Saccharicenans subterraneum]
MNRQKKKESGLVYVIQKHLASRLHYDLRLEENGVLKSWALPKEPPTTSAEKRLAVEVEDHPLGYEDFEGSIPEGEYGAGRVEIWDRGTYQPLHRDQDLREILIQGKKLRGVYTLVRIKDRRQGKENLWLFFRNKNQEKSGLKNEKNSNRKSREKFK